MTASGVPFVELIQPVIQVQPNPSRAVRLTMVAHSAQAKTRVSTPVSGGSMLGTTRISLIGTSHFGQCGSLIRTPRSAPDYGGKIIHTRSCNLGVPLKYNVAGTVARRSGG